MGGGGRDFLTSEGSQKVGLRNTSNPVLLEQKGNLGGRNGLGPNRGEAEKRGGRSQKACTNNPHCQKKLLQERRGRKGHETK